MHTFFEIVIVTNALVAAIAIVKFYKSNQTVQKCHLYPTLHDIIKPNSIRVPHVTT